MSVDAASGGTQEPRVSAASLAALRSVLGEGGVTVHAPEFVDGVALHVTLRPPDGDSLARTLAVLGEERIGAVVRGGGTQLGLGNRPSTADVILAVDALDAILEFDPQDGVVHTGAGTEIAALAAHVRAGGWELPLESARAGGTVGGAISTAAIGPRRLAFGRPRDCVLGLSVAHATGERTHCGGRVVKNVTGYDLGKLYAGSLGTLAVIESAWVRLRPLPAARIARCLLSKGSRPEGPALVLALEAARRDSARTVAWVSPEIAARHEIATGGGTWVLLAEYAGHEESVAEDVAWLERAGAAASLSSIPVDGTAVDRLADAQSAGRVRARIAVLPSALAATCVPLLDAGVGLVVHPGVGLVYAISHEPNAQRVLAAVDAAVAIGVGRGGADVRFEELPLTAKAGRDVFGDAGAHLSLLRALKRQFDPVGTLNPGRFQGWV